MRDCEEDLITLRKQISNFKMLPIMSIQKDELDTLNDIVSTYSRFKFIKKLEPREMAVMAFYLKYGYSNSTKNKIINFLEIKRKHLTQLNYKLVKKGLLINGEHKKQNKTLSKEMQQVSDYFKNENNVVRILITIKKDDKK